MGRRILVIDDDATILDLIRAVLLEEGHDVDVALNGAEALAKDSRPPEVCVLDMFLPGISGPDLVTALRDKFGQDLPILLTSASIVEREAEQLGAYEYLPKPFDLEELLGAVRRGLDGSSS
ncbi:MAG TPA: response regulator [Chloroflexota bacterium]|nr:response regulator [Chloroflexota bacterium]